MEDGWGEIGGGADGSLKIDFRVHVCRNCRNEELNYEVE